MSMSQSTVHIADRDITLFVRRRDGQDPSLPPLVLLHGWPASSHGWEAVVSALPPDRTVLCPDLRGLGQSERAGTVQTFSKQELARDITALLHILEIENFVIGGQDWGGAVAQEVALAEPERTAALIIMNINLINNLPGNLKGYKVQMASPLNPRWYMAFQSVPDLPEAMIPGSEEAWIRYFFENGSAPDATLSEAVIASYVADYAREGTAHCGANYYRAMPIDAARWASLNGVKFTSPSLLLYGNQDPFLIPEFYQGYEKCFQAVERVDVPGGHFIQDERPSEVAEAIQAFMEKQGV